RGLHFTINHFINTKKEMTTHSYTLELTSSLPPAKVFKANVLEGHKFSSLALPGIVASSAIIHGDGGVGSIRETKFTDAVPVDSVKERIDLLDKDNFECKLALIEGGDIGDKLESATYHVKVVPAAGGGSVYKIHNEVKTCSGVEPNNEKVEESKKGITDSFKAIEAYVLANPNCV
ncbi:pathogenesis-related BetVI family protein, partial [Ralstonia pseudosolanacearum]|uniref:pathogenesis-related BetVI family protein n=1 Tax=Ralstonia pseudosolanacearum TaxID=1310165 RepID=UPI003CF6F49C